MNYRRTITIATTVIALLLAMLLGLGLRQYSLSNRHQDTVRQAEKLIYQYAMIREFIVEVLLSGQTAKLSGVVLELEELGLQTAKLLQSSDHAQHSLDLARSFDISSLILLLKGMSEHAPVAQIQQINRELRNLGEHFFLLDRSLVQQARLQLVQLQYIVIGALALATSGLLLLLLSLYRRTFAPLVELAAQSDSPDGGGAESVSATWPDPTLERLAASLRRCRETLRHDEEARQIHQRTMDSVRRAGTQLTQSGGREKVLQHCCRSLLDNPDYCLAWIGLADPQGQDVIPISADASTTMTREECASCMTVLLTAAEEEGLEFNPAARALQEGRPVLHENILANTPRGLLKNTPLADGQAVCAAFPLRLAGENLGVLSLYAQKSASFGPAEMNLIMGMADCIALRLRLWEHGEKLARCQLFLRHCRANAHELLAILDHRGTIVETGAALGSLCAKNAQALIGRHLSSCFRPTDPKASGELPWDGTTTPVTPEIQVLALTSIANDQRWRCRLAPLTDDGGAIGHYGLWGSPRQPATLDTPAAVQECGSMLPILGRITASSAHDIRDVASGIINYAQLGQDSHPEAGDIFGKILKAGERMADVARALVFYGQQEDAVEEFLPVSVVLADTVKLLSSLCHNEHIRLDVSQQDDLSRCHLPARPLQQILCTLLLRGRRALNSRYPGVDGRKRLHIQARTLRDGGEELLEITVTDWGVAVGTDLRAAAADSDIPQRERTSALAISRCRQLAQALGGQLRVSEQPNSNSMILTLPLQHAPEHHITAASDETP